MIMLANLRSLASLDEGRSSGDGDLLAIDKEGDIGGGTDNARRGEEARAWVLAMFTGARDRTADRTEAALGWRRGHAATAGPGMERTEEAMEVLFADEADNVGNTPTKLRAVMNDHL